MFCLSLNIAELNFINSIKRTTKKKKMLSEINSKRLIAENRNLKRSNEKQTNGNVWIVCVLHE